MTRLLRRPILNFTIIVGVLYIMYALIPPGMKHIADMILLSFLAFAFAWAVVLMVTRTRVWTERGLGLLGTVSGDALLYFAIVAGGVIGLKAQVVDLARACFTVGVILLLIGLIRASRDDAGERVVIEDSEPRTPSSPLT